MYNVSAILPHGEGIGFSLAGARVMEAGSASEAAEILETEMDDDKSGVILVDETYLEALPERLKKRRTKAQCHLSWAYRSSANGNIHTTGRKS